MMPAEREDVTDTAATATTHTSKKNSNQETTPEAQGGKKIQAKVSVKWLATRFKCHKRIYNF